MGCCSAKLSRSIPVADDEDPVRSSINEHVLDLKKVIERNPELKAIALSYRDFILPRMKSDHDAVARWIDNVRFGVDTVRELMLSLPRGEGEEEEEATVDDYAETVAELEKFMLASHLLADDRVSEALETAMDMLREQKERISKRQRSIQRWRRVSSAVFMAAFIGVLMVSVGLALFGAAPVAIAAATAGATVIKAVEPFANSVLDDKERRLKDETEVVEMLRDGELLAREFNGVRPQVEKVAKEVEEYLVNPMRFAGEWRNVAEAAEVAAAEMKKKIEEVESSVKELERKVNGYVYNMIQQFESKFIRIIRN
ncbi:UPF0496 protein 1-like [Curcuma longa]|uniref:UPF0496 protein 1-like n=1 Tax=Curcuma longa TaxID=136217 RepID=UPI003D9F021D